MAKKPKISSKGNKKQKVRKRRVLNPEPGLELLIEHTSTNLLRTRYFGDVQAYCFRYIPTKDEILTLVFGTPSKANMPLVRIHSRCLTGDVFGSAHCECGQQLELSLQKMRAEGNGVFIYLEQEGRGSGLAAKLKAYEYYQQEGLDTVDSYERLGLPVDKRSYEAAISILKFLGIRRLRLLTNNPAKVMPLEQAGLQVEREIIEIPPNKWNIDYLRTKKQRMGHLLDKL
ncbi:GTP cyclohydrolase II [Candidatus Dojkabacteria bacterium]|nr:GTP cyclohydrolase II [Candidatus Dojkabacteria bacterium]